MSKRCMIEITYTDGTEGEAQVFIEGERNKRVLQIKGSGDFFMEDIVESWKYPHNISEWQVTENKKISFEETLRIVAAVYLSDKDQRGRWWRQVNQLMVLDGRGKL